MTLLVRHAESAWNVPFGLFRIDAGIPDPALTERGRGQAAELAGLLAATSPLRRIVASPYRRALETAAIIAARLGLPVSAEPLVRERCAFSCDMGSAPADLAAAWPAIDFGGLDPVWWGGMIESMESVRARAARFAGVLAAAPDAAEVLVVSHWGFIRALTGRECANAEIVDLKATRPVVEPVLVADMPTATKELS